MYGKPYYRTTGATTATVTAASAEVATTLAASKTYVFASSTACWIRQAAVTTAAVAGAANNSFVPAGLQVFIHGSNGAFLTVIRDAADGRASVTPIDEI